MASKLMLLDDLESNLYDLQDDAAELGLDEVVDLLDQAANWVIDKMREIEDIA